MNKTRMRLLLAGLAALTSLATPRPAHAQGVVARVDHTDLGALHWQLAAQAATFQAVTCFEMIDLLHARVVHHLELSPGQRLSSDRPGVTVGPDMGQANVDALTAKLASVHMDVVSYGVTSFGAGEADARKVFALGKALKVKVIVADPANAPLELLDRLAGEYGVTVALVNGAKPASDWDPAALLASLQGRSARLGVCADVAQFRRSGLVPQDCLQKLSGHIIEVRLGDVDAQGHEVPIGAGVAGDEAVLRYLKAQGFIGIFAVGSQAGAGPARTDSWVTSVNGFSDLLAKVAAQKGDLK